MQKFSFFRTNKALVPEGSLTLEQLVEGIRSGTWRRAIEAARKATVTHYKRLKGQLPAVTISALLRSREGEMARKLIRHSGFICVDVDHKDNLKLKVDNVVDKECLAQFISPSGKGIKIIYACKPTNDPAVHRRTYDAVVQRLKHKGIKITLDPVVKSVVSLQYVSYDPNAYFNPKSKLIIGPLPPIKRKEVKINPDVLGELNEYIDGLGNRDVTANYEDWLNVMFGLSYSLGEAGREPMHKICKHYPHYSKSECDEKYDGCLDETTDNPITINTVFQLLAERMPKAEATRLHKKYSRTHAVGVGEEIKEGAPELAGLVKYKLFLFKAKKDKDGDVVDLEPVKLNLLAFETLLNSLGFKRHSLTQRGTDKILVRIVDNIVDVVDVPTILYQVTRHIESEGDYHFKYKDTEYKFSVEDLLYRWMEIRAQGTTANQISAAIPIWVPNLLKDTVHESFIPYKNGVVRVDKATIRLVPYSQMTAQIWRERILNRDYKLDRTRGMFEEFFANVLGKGNNLKQRSRSPEFKRNVWYYGYILHATKRQSTARAWLVYDMLTGNMGRSGKTMLGTAVGFIRNVAVIDGKRVDLNDRFAFQNVRPWTNVILVDDPDRRASLNPLFNMISGKTQTESKGQDILEVDAKLMICSNYVLELIGDSEKGRQFISQASRFYPDYAKAHETIQPIVDLHGKEFFTDWNDVDWNRFDTFSTKALQSHLRDAPPKDTIIGNAMQMRFIQTYEEELLYALGQSLTEHCKPMGEGSAIVQAILIDVVREHAPDIRKPGIVAKEFLRCVGCTDIRNSTIRVGGGPKNVWVFKESLNKLKI